MSNAGITKPETANAITSKSYTHRKLVENG